MSKKSGKKEGINEGHLWSMLGIIASLLAMGAMFASQQSPSLPDIAIFGMLLAIFGIVINKKSKYED